MINEIARALDVQGLRSGFIKYTRQAYRLLPVQVKPRILDIGCGSGTVTLELARLSGGEIVGIDIDGSVLDALRQSVENERLSDRVTAKHGSLIDADFPEQCFDLLWEEGVLHMLEPARNLAKCSQLLKPNGLLVSCETLEWFKANQSHYSAQGFELIDRLVLPTRCWWDDYYALLEQRISALRATYGGSRDLSMLRRYDDEIEMVKKDPVKFDCGFFALEKRE